MSLETAAQFYASADYSRALQAAIDAANGPDAGSALLIAAKCFIALGDHGGLGQVIAFAQQQGTAPEQTFFRILRDCLMDGMSEPLVALEAAIPDGILQPIALYHASCARMVLGDEPGALQGFNRFRLGLPRFFNALPFGTDDSFNVMFRQGTLVLPPEETVARLAQGRGMPPAQSAIEILRQASESVDLPIVMCCADARYIDYFLPRWLAAMASCGHSVHVHVINPDTASLALIDRLAIEHDLGARLSASVSTDAQATATSYACARFEIVPLLLEAFGRSLIAVDIDVVATPVFQGLASLPLSADFSCFETGRFEPASVHQASIMIFRRTPAGLQFVRDLAAYCRPKLNQAVRINWMLDQAAMFSVIRLYAASMPGFRYEALDHKTGRSLSDFIVGLATEEEKHAIKVKSAGLDAAAHPSGNVNVVWEP